MIDQQLTVERGYELQNEIIERSHVFTNLLNFFNYKPAETVNDFNVDEFERVCYDLNIHRLYGFGGCNLDLWVDFFKRNCKALFQFINTLPEDDIEQFEILFDGCFEGLSAKDVIGCLAERNNQLIADFAEFTVMFVLEHIADVLDEVTPEP